MTANPPRKFKQAGGDWTGNVGAGRGDLYSRFNHHLFLPSGRIRVVNGFLNHDAPPRGMPDPTERTEIYFKRTGTFDRENARIDRWGGSEANRDLIRAFQQHLFAKGSRSYRVGKLTAQLRRTADLIGKDLSRLGKSEAEAFLAAVNRREGWSPHTQRDYIRTFKQFFLWFQDEDPRLENGDVQGRKEARRFYQYVRKISTAHPRKSLDYSGVLTDKDAQALLQKGAQNALERALVAFLHETGVRVGELLGVRIRDIERKGQYALVRVDGKTGERRVPIVQSLPWVEQWLRDHPARENPDALLWVSTHNGHRGEPLRHIGVLRMLRRVVQEAGVKKRHNPHWFRHSRATISAAHYSEQVLCKLMGWELGSKQVRTYVHLGAGQVEAAFLEQEGLQTAEKKQEFRMQTCVCGQTNTPESRYCYVCGRPLSVGVMLEDEKQKNAAIEEAMQEYAKIMADPARAARFMAFYKTFEKMQGGGAE